MEESHLPDPFASMLLFFCLPAIMESTLFWWNCDGCYERDYAMTAGNGISVVTNFLCIKFLHSNGCWQQFFFHYTLSNILIKVILQVKPNKMLKLLFHDEIAPMNSLSDSLGRAKTYSLNMVFTLSTLETPWIHIIQPWRDDKLKEEVILQQK